MFGFTDHHTSRPLPYNSIFGVSAISIVGFERCYVPCVSSVTDMLGLGLEIASVPSASTFVIGVIPRAKKIEKRMNKDF